MALIFPLALPTTGVARQMIEPRRVDYQAPEAGGRLGSVAAGFPLWYGRWTVGEVSGATSDEWRAFVAALEGSRRLFLGRDLTRPLPKAYLSTGLGSFPTTAPAWGREALADDVPGLGLSGMTPGFVITRGDYIGFRWTTGGEARRAMVRALEPFTVNSEGWAIFAVTPAVPMVVPSDAVAHFDNPACLMRQLVSETQVGEMDQRRSVAVTLAGVQDLIP